MAKTTGTKTNKTKRKPKGPAGPVPMARRDLDPVELQAMARVVSKEAEACRGKLEPGNHAVDFCVRVHGDLMIGLAGSQQQNRALQAEILLGLVLEKFDVTQLPAVVNSIAKKCEAWANGAEPPVVQQAVPDYVAKLIAATTRKVTVNTRGAITSQLSVEPLKLVK